MFRKLTLSLSLFIPLLLSNTANADTLWQYGIDDDNARGRLNAMEFNHTEGHTDYFDSYLVSTDTKGTTILEGPGYMHESMSFVEICTSLGFRCKDHDTDYHSVGEITIDYINNSPNECTNVQLTYDRHGTEYNTITFVTFAFEETDEVEINIGGKEGNQIRHTIELQNIAPFDVSSFTLRYEGNGSDNGHFIDYIELEADGC